MPSAQPPRLRVTLSDGQKLRGRLHAWGQFPKAGWMAWAWKFRRTPGLVGCPGGFVSVVLDGSVTSRGVP